MSRKIFKSRLCKIDRAGIGLVEMLVAVALMAMMIGFAAVIFKVSTQARRTVRAQAEVMQKLRVITEQLDRDFRGLRKDAPLAVWFDKRVENDPNRFDQIMFFADGDFQSNQMYNFDGDLDNRIPMVMGSPSSVDNKRIVGNLARIHYGHGRVSGDTGPYLPWEQNIEGTSLQDDPLKRKRAGVMTRRQHILSANPKLIPWPTNDTFDSFVNESTDLDGFRFYNECFYEHDSLSLSEWQNVKDGDTWPNILLSCFGDDHKTPINYARPDTLLNLMCEGVSSFSVQWGYFDPNKEYDELEPQNAVLKADDVLCWFPSDDPDGQGNFDNTFSLNSTKLGVLINQPKVEKLREDWEIIESREIKFKTGSVADPNQFMFNGSFMPKFFPDALKFTIRLHDKNGILKEKDKDGQLREGKTFTHIVYIGDRR